MMSRQGRLDGEILVGIGQCLQQLKQTADFVHGLTSFADKPLQFFQQDRTEFVQHPVFNDRAPLFFISLSYVEIVFPQYP